VIHVLKIWPEYFDDVDSGRKPFEVRRDDRGYELGDLLCLREWDRHDHEHTGRATWKRVTYIMRRPSPVRSALCEHEAAIDRRYAVLGLAGVDRELLLPAPTRCPICEGPGVLDPGRTGGLEAIAAVSLVLRSTCTDCGWHYTPKDHCCVCGKLAIVGISDGTAGGLRQYCADHDPTRDGGDDADPL
jgi:hypothetical protein